MAKKVHTSFERSRPVFCCRETKKEGGVLLLSPPARQGAGTDGRADIHSDAPPPLRRRPVSPCVFFSRPPLRRFLFPKEVARIDRFCHLLGPRVAQTRRGGGNKATKDKRGMSSSPTMQVFCQNASSEMEMRHALPPLVKRKKTLSTDQSITAYVLLQGHGPTGWAAWVTARWGGTKRFQHTFLQALLAKYTSERGLE